MDEDGWSKGRDLIGEYLDGIDAEISAKLQRFATPLETTLTQEFLACLDPRERDRERPDGPYASLCRLLAQSRAVADLDALDDAGPLRSRITAIEHPAGYEGYVSHADIGLVIEHAETAGMPTLPRSAYVLQAKKLYPGRGSHGPVFEGHCSFGALGDEQLFAMRKLQEEIEDGAVKYLYYMPRRSVFQPSSSPPNRIKPATAARIGQGMPIDGPEDGIWIGELSRDTVAKTAIQVHRLNGKGTSPFRTFILDHMSRAGMFGTSGQSDPQLLAKRAAFSFGGSGPLAYGIATGEASIVEQVVERLRKKSVASPVLPATTMRLTIPRIPSPRPPPPVTRFGSGI